MKYSLFLIFGTLFIILASCNKKQIQSTKQFESDIDWAKGAVWYQIFPERFYNATKKNDRRKQNMPPAIRETDWQTHPWTSGWYTLQPWEREISDRFYDVVYQRRYGGDLLGVTEKLDYLKSLGIDGIYFNPIFEAHSLHKYDGASYHHIDDNFGPAPLADRRRITEAQETENPDTWIWTRADSTFLTLIKEAHARGIKVVIDGVFNHTGRDFFAFKDILQYQQDSRYAEWYEVTSWDVPETETNEFDYKGWWGVKSLPELAEDEQGIVSGPREYIFAATRRWMDPNGDGDPSDGIDGWRLDVAEEVARPFWQEWYAHVKSINPQAITVAEIWHDASDWIKSRCFDGTMNYLWSKATVRFFIDRNNEYSGNTFAEDLKSIQKQYGDSIALHLWNLMDSHDTDRLASMIINPNRQYDRQASPKDNPDYKVRKPNARERSIQKLIAAFQMTWSGAPMIYYGTEAGMWGADDPDDRKPMVWPEMQFEPETQHPLPGRQRPADYVAFNHELFRFYQRLIQLRHEYPALMRGTINIENDLLAENIFAFSRRLGDRILIALFNRAEAKQTVMLPESLRTKGVFRNALNDTIDDRAAIELLPFRFVVLVNDS